ncbi:MAG: hypothetical protein Q9178_006032 [Gyalolechia marmorata]
MDIPGTVALLRAFTGYILALERGGVTKKWSSLDVIGCLIGWVSLTILFLIIQYDQGDRALLLIDSSPNSHNFLLVYNLPIYFQAIHNASPISGGIRNLPLVLTTDFFEGVCVIIGEGLGGKVGYFQPFLMLRAGLSTICAGLIYRLDIHSSAGQYIGHKILVGAGLGISIQVPVIAAQALSALSDIALVITSILFFQLTSSAFAISAAQSIFNNQVISNLADFAPEISPGQIIQAGSTKIPENFAKEQVLGVLLSYMAGLNRVGDGNCIGRSHSGGQLFTGMEEYQREWSWRCHGLIRVNKLGEWAKDP